ncbi:UNVERIFIED_CONTAM: hypothetical protein NCL1_45437 [Trichonephila clavipes]
MLNLSRAPTSSCWSGVVIVKPHIPLIKFRKGSKDVPGVNQKISSGSKTLGVSPSRSQKGSGIDESELPAKYSRKPLSQIEIEFIEVKRGTRIDVN